MATFKGVMTGAWKYTLAHPVTRCIIYAALTHELYTLGWFKWWVPLLPLIALTSSAAQAHLRLAKFIAPSPNVPTPAK